MSNVNLLLDNVPLTVAPDGSITGNHDLVPLCNLKVSRTAYSPNRQHTAIALLQKLGAALLPTVDSELFTYPADFDPFVWY